MSRHDDALYISLIYQLLESKGETKKLSPGVRQFIRGLREEYEVINWENPETASYIFHYADSVLNDDPKIKRKLH